MDRCHYLLDFAPLLLQSHQLGRVTGSHFALAAEAVVALSFGAFRVLSLPAQEAAYLLCSSLSLQ